MKQQEKAVEVKDIIKGLTEPIEQPADQPGRATTIVINGGINYHHTITINHPPQLDDLVSLIKSHLVQLTASPASPSHPSTRSPTRSNPIPASPRPTAATLT